VTPSNEKTERTDATEAEEDTPVPAGDRHTAEIRQPEWKIETETDRAGQRATE